MTEQEKAYFNLQKYYLSLQHKLEECKMAGIDPPEYLLRKNEETKRRLWIFSKVFK